MKSVFIGGSRRLGRMNLELALRVDNIIREDLYVFVGDANGFDRAAQKYLAEKGYRSVFVYCTNGQCRNNVGDWPIRAVDFRGRGRGLEFFTAKDDAMLRDADYGLFAWDGKSKGTLRNIREMAEQRKQSVVYVSPNRRFVTIRRLEEVEMLSPDGTTDSPASLDLFSDATRQMLCTPEVLDD